MNWGFIALGFGLGTFKFLFAHWTVHFSAMASDSSFTLFELFTSVTAGAWFSMAIFYFTSGIFMRRAHAKKLNAIMEAEKKGIEYKRKKSFTKMNKTIIWIKRNIGIYGVTLLAPLFLSVPIGSVVCAKFYGNRKRTFVLMMFFTSMYSTLMCLWIFATL
jgi:hypothetical protein